MHPNTLRTRQRQRLLGTLAKFQLRGFAPYEHGRSVKMVRASYRAEKPMIVCDSCSETKDCLEKEIEGKQYDICTKCWNPLAQRLKGIGRTRRQETVILPPPRKLEDTPESRPREPPKTWGANDGFESATTA